MCATRRSLSHSKQPPDRPRKRSSPISAPMFIFRRSEFTSVRQKEFFAVFGQLIKRANYKPSPPLSQEEWQERLSMVQRIVSELQKFNFPGAPPSLQVKFAGDVAELEDARVEATLHGERLQRGNYEMKNLSAVAEWNNQRLDVAHCEWSDGMGSFVGHAE